MYEIKERLINTDIKHKRDINSYIADVTGKHINYFERKVAETGIQVRIRSKAVTQRTNRMGMFVLLCRGDMNWQECLKVYMGMDIVENGFDLLKNDGQLQPPGVQSEGTMRGRLFVAFIGLILKMKLLKKMQDRGLIKQYSFTGMLTELQKLKQVERSSGEIFITEQTKQQRLIFEMLKSCAKIYGKLGYEDNGIIDSINPIIVISGKFLMTAIRKNWI